MGVAGADRAGFPLIAIAFAVLGRHYPSAGGVAHFVNMAFGPRMERVTGWLFLSVIPVGLPAALHIATGFSQALFGWHDGQLLPSNWERWPLSGGWPCAEPARAPICKRWWRS